MTQCRIIVFRGIDFLFETEFRIVLIGILWEEQAISLVKTQFHLIYSGR